LNRNQSFFKSALKQFDSGREFYFEACVSHGRAANLMVMLFIAPRKNVFHKTWWIFSRPTPTGQKSLLELETFLLVANQFPPGANYPPPSCNQCRHISL